MSPTQYCHFCAGTGHVWDPTANQGKGGWVNCPDCKGTGQR